MSDLNICRLEIGVCVVLIIGLIIVTINKPVMIFISPMVIGACLVALCISFKIYNDLKNEEA